MIRHQGRRFASTDVSECVAKQRELAGLRYLTSKQLEERTNQGQVVVAKPVADWFKEPVDMGSLNQVQIATGVEVTYPPLQRRSHQTLPARVVATVQAEAASYTAS